MPEQPTQNFQNHVRNDPKLFAAMFILLAALIIAIVDFFVATSLIGVAVVLLVIGVLVLGYATRIYATTVQDRVVMLEMRLRLANILTGDLKDRIPDLSRSQLIALRFESDANLNDLTRKVLDENLTNATEIKKLVKDWQGDFHRV